MPKSQSEFGGSLSKNKRKSKRPLNVKRPIHIVFRSTKAIHKFSLFHPNNKANINALVYDLSLKYKIRIYNFVNSGNHLHLLIHSKDKLNLQNYFRELASKIALFIYSGKGKFWTSIVYTKLLSWGKQFKNVDHYLIQNELEVLKAIPYQSRRIGCSKKKCFLILNSG